MGKKKIRKSRWTYREHLKRAANRNGTLSAQHPQVRRQLQEKEERNHGDQ